MSLKMRKVFMKFYKYKTGLARNLGLNLLSVLFVLVKGLLHGIYFINKHA